MATTPSPNAIFASYYLKLGETTPWVLKEDQNGTPGPEAHVQAQAQDGHKLKVSVQAVGQPKTEHEVQVTDSGGLFPRGYHLLNSTIENLGEVRWKSGLQIPAEWKIGQTISAVSDAHVHTPVLTDFVVLSFHLKGFVELRLPA